MKSDNVNNNSILRLGEEKIGKLLLIYSVPAIIAMVASALYNITDSIFIGKKIILLPIKFLVMS